jgi:hypothetical protein
LNACFGDTCSNVSFPSVPQMQQIPSLAAIYVLDDPAHRT